MPNCTYKFCSNELHHATKGQGFCSKGCRLEVLRLEWANATGDTKKRIEHMAERIRSNN